MAKICLLSITASHYRKRIYQLLDEQLSCSFIFGKDNTSVKRLDTSLFASAVDVPNRYIGSGAWYFQPGLSGIVKDYNIIINDLGILCLSSWWIMILAKFRRQKVYTWGHWWYGRESFSKRLLKKAYDKLSDGNFVYGNYARDLMIKNGFNAQKLHVIHNSLDYDTQLELRRSLSASDIYSSYYGNDYPVLCFIGRLTAVKKLDQLIDSVSLLKQNGKSYNIVFIGDGPEKEKLEKQAEYLVIKDQVWFYGACYDEATNAELVYNADLCVAPGNIGLTAMHAMMFGCPCVSHDDFPWQMPEFEAIVPHKTGAFFKRDDVKSLADIIDGWFSSDGKNREQVRNNCYREIDENWNPHKQIEIIKKNIGYGL